MDRAAVVGAGGEAARGAEPSASDGGRLLRIGLKVCIVMLAVVGLLHLHARLPRPAVPPAVAAAIVRLGDLFSRMVHGLDRPQPLVSASEPMFAAIGGARGPLPRGARRARRRHRGGERCGQRSLTDKRRNPRAAVTPRDGSDRWGYRSCLGGP